MQSILYIILAPVIFSALYLATRVYYAYFAKSKLDDAKDKRLEEMYCGTDCSAELEKVDSVAKPERQDKTTPKEVVPVVVKPKRVRKPKKVEPLSDSSLEVPTKKKVARKKKES